MSSYTIDGCTVKDPITQRWAERYSPHRDDYGRFIVSAFWEFDAVFNTSLSKSEFSAWFAKADETARTIVCPSPLDPSTYTTFSNVYIKYISATITAGQVVHYENAIFRVRHLNTLSLPAFGA